MALIALLAALYLRAVRVLARRGYRVPRGQQALWWVGVALMAARPRRPVDALADDLLLAPTWPSTC